MVEEVEMTDSQPNEVATKPSTEGGLPSIQEQLATNIKLIEKAVHQKDTRLLFSKVLRRTQALRGVLGAGDVKALVEAVFPKLNLSMEQLIVELLEKKARDGRGSMDTGFNHAASFSFSGATISAAAMPEVEIYIYILALLVFIDAKEWMDARSLALDAVENRLSKFNRRTLDMFAARIYFYLSLATEKCGLLMEIRSSLLGLHRLAVIRHDEIGQETLLNLLLRNYLAYDQYEQAEALRAKAQRDNYRSPHQQCRFMFYFGRIRAVRLEYTDARDALMQALRRAPESTTGFRVVIVKWLTVVRLLLGEIPARAEFESPAEFSKLLMPYAQLAATVRQGDLSGFSTLVSTYTETFRRDKTLHLISRLRANVIRAGLRRIATAYSRISLSDVAAKLGLSSTEDAEFVVAKAIRDKGIAAKIDHGAGIMIASVEKDIYSTDEPQAAFHARIAFCMDVHNEVQKAMRYEVQSQRREWEEANQARERQETELAAALEDDETDF
jgi:26S proteasome regulatory subunit N3